MLKVKELKYRVLLDDSKVYAFLNDRLVTAAIFYPEATEEELAAEILRELKELVEENEEDIPRLLQRMEDGAWSCMEDD